MKENERRLKRNGTRNESTKTDRTESVELQRIRFESDAASD
jgi:hypothetical protein